MKKKLRLRQVIAMLLTVVMLFNTVTMDIFATGTNDAETIKVIEDVVAADDDTSDGGGASESEDGASDGNGAAAESDSDASGDSGDALDPGLSVDDIPDADAEPGSEVSGGILEGSSDIVSLSLEDYDDPAPVVGEDVSKREANIKYFLNEDLTYTAAIYPMTVHYYEDGQWKDIDNGFKAAVLDGDSSYIENKANRMKVRFAQDTQQTKLVQISIGGYQLSWGMDTGSRISARRMTDNTNDLMDKAMPVIDASLDTEVPPGITERMDAAASEIVDDGSEKETRETLEGESEKETEETSDPGSEKGTKETSDTVTEKETQETMDTEPEKEDPSIISRETLGLQSGAASIDLTAETDAGLAPKDHEPVGVHTAASAATETATQESLMLMGLASQMMMTAGSTVAAAPDAVYISNDDPGEETLDGAYHLAKIKDDAASMDLDTLGSRVVYDNIYSGVSLEYVLCGETLKENIILASAQSNRTFMYDCMAEGLTPQLADNRISFKDPSGQEVLGIQAPFMYDAAGIYSDAVTLGLEPAGSGWRISITADQDWLLAADRQYPVVIDPVISTSTAHADIQDARVSSLHPDTNYINEYVLSTGYSSSTGTNYSFMKFQLPDLDSSDIIVDATVDLTVFTSSGLSTKVDLHDVTADWDSSTITWNNKPAYDPVVADYDSFVDIEENHCYFVITDIVKGWYRGEPNYGVMAKDAKEASDSYRAFYSSDYTVASVCPQIKITYINATGLEAFWTYHSQSIGRAGTGYVNDYTGNMVLVHSTAATSGNRMPASLTHVYNSNDSAINLGYGHGFRLNYHQRLEPVTIADTQYYKYTDEDGTRHYFKKDTSKNKWLVDSGIDLELTIGTASDEKYTIKDKSDQKLIFDDAGHLVKVQDANGNALTIGYSNDRISRITDGAGRIMTLTYDSSGNLASVVSPDGTKTFTYTGGDLTKITDIDGRSVDYTYAGHLMTAAVNIDGYKMQYTYTTGLMDRVTKISEYAGSVQGQSVSIVYDDNSTTFTDHRSRTETYAFNDAGHTVTIYNDEGYAESAKYLTAEGTNKNKLSKASKLQYTVVQMAHDPEGTSLTSWHGTNGYALNTDAANARVGTTSLKLIGDANASAFHQNIFIEKGKTYTFSAYVRPEGTLADGKNCYVRLRYQDGSNNEVVTSSSEMIPCEDGWYRLECTATVPTDSMSDDVYVFMLVDPGVTAYFDCMQLESGDTASRYDLVENGDHMALADSKTLTFSGNTMYDSVVDLDALNSGSYALTSKVSSGLVTTSALNVRSGPGTGYSINASVSKDQRVYIFDTVVDTSGITWYNIAWCSGERVYYGYASAVYINKDQSDTVTVERALSDTSLLYVRAGAGTGYGAIGVVSYKNEVQIIDTVTANGQEWYVVHYTKNGLGYTGCALSDLVLTYADVMTQSRIPERSHNDDLDDHVVMMYGYSDDVKKATQTIDIAGSKGDAYMFNAWGCGLSVALREDTRHFGVEVRFFGTDGKEYAHVSDFKENGDAWMFLNDVAVADADYS